MSKFVLENLSFDTVSIASDSVTSHMSSFFHHLSSSLDHIFQSSSSSSSSGPATSFVYAIETADMRAMEKFEQIPSLGSQGQLPAGKTMNETCNRPQSQTQSQSLNPPQRHQLSATDLEWLNQWIKCDKTGFGSYILNKNTQIKHIKYYSGTESESNTSDTQSNSYDSNSDSESDSELDTFTDSESSLIRSESDAESDEDNSSCKAGAKENKTNADSVQQHQVKNGHNDTQLKLSGTALDEKSEDSNMPITQTSKRYKSSDQIQKTLLKPDIWADMSLITKIYQRYRPRNPYIHSPNGCPIYPLIPAENWNLRAMFEKRYDLDTLFFIFYYQQGSYQQYLASRELRNLSWRYHKQYLTWFQRQEEPKFYTPHYERGSYVYFDHDSGWSQRVKQDFHFEYRFLENTN